MGGGTWPTRLLMGLKASRSRGRERWRQGRGDLAADSSESPRRSCGHARVSVLERGTEGRDGKGPREGEVRMRWEWERGVGGWEVGWVIW